MSILEKVRDFFYDEEEDIVEEIKKKPYKHQKEKKEKIKKIDKFDNNDDKLEEQNISERELFKAERTFNFPFDVDEEDVKVQEQVEIKEENKDKLEPYKKNNAEFKESRPLSIRNYSKHEKEKKEEPVKKFKPTPVISPIYGILDKNYKKEDLLISDNKEEEQKKLDYETVRKKAYSNIYNNEEQSDTKGIFFNLDDEKKDEEDVKIIYNEIDTEEDDKNKTIGEKIEEYEKSLDEDNNIETDDDQILSETKEQDLFNLIDNMYNSDEEDEEEE